jgi:predicted transglutaminase-like cysteine proteinase
MWRRAFAVMMIATFTTMGAAEGGQRSAASSPLGFKVFCLKNPGQCRQAPDRRLEASPELLSVLKSVNLGVNRAIRPKGEKASKDVWSIEPATGDCEDYAITKRARLIRQGIPAGALRIAYAKTRRGENHAVLLVQTSQGNLVLDNLTNAIKPMSQAGLRFISISGANPKKWASL